MKLSGYVANGLVQTMSAGKVWLPFISFILVMLVVMLLIRMLAGFIQKTFEWAMLGWLNRLGGILLYAFLYLLFLSVAVFYLRQMHILNDNSAAASVSYPFLKEMGPVVIESLGRLIPVFRDLFDDLKAYFERFGENRLSK